MNITIRKIGNSEGVILPKEVLDRMGVKAGDALEAQFGTNSLTLRVPDEQFSRQLAHADAFMERYRVALKKLAE
ncbi:AbrB/MazE/SpoVT family DNA-binding domain-containing protein [Rhizobium sp. Leaf341]|uniref:AbrB/MazE/SpoVT family DNA-binding domain-containing protein n=1 Tax=Rhizobium sp. Leaf341 TaxID=1736344 RepID=UPI0007135755|nr:AbrB/MazE/SpoVT family DNA-binding domain-containing protein [Rhizobium sp. Leaf341]KQR73373.1 AbrB family transcriptional regulator [Rhizobium sp. Leaf341]